MLILLHCTDATKLNCDTGQLVQCSLFISRSVHKKQSVQFMSFVYRMYLVLRRWQFWGLSWESVLSPTLWLMSWLAVIISGSLLNSRASPLLISTTL